MDWLAGELADIRDKGLYRRLNTIESAQTPRIIKDGRELIHLSSNNYLGLTGHPEVKRAAAEALHKYGTGSGGSRLTGGNTDLYNSLEDRIARFKGTEAAIVFSTGYMANIGTIAAIMNKGDLILSDELNHASIIDGCRLSRAEIKIYPHMDVSCIENTLQSSRHRRKLIVTDGVFSMDGDIAPLPEIFEIAEKYDAMVMVDDAHATGVMGRQCRGTADYYNVKVDINMGTLSKALASIGGYVAGSNELIEYLRNRARAFIYSTALPPSAVAAAKAAIDVIEDENPARKLWQNVARYRRGLTDMGFSITSKTQIIPLITGDSKRTLDAASDLERLGVYASGIRPPTVHEGRIRTSLMATHSEKDINEALDAIYIVKEKFRL
ncbi:8-amino-7-oxononanoate synthase [Candidatus Methanoperedens nitroreducens]|uniref:8-amino-7-ketopelargonate synthase n=1 Tax=Candidatus Methanoperedens nitratireducens TaxID=1392998 RepID=A0A062V7T4_9EURY|nr:8-amino-7-oxononanoate synthase [Candidatus Methanoperedens nitroreducens]KCZ71829.1 8-amino-7-oxononanoate synthase [Candidatus Methanoperedens nitroreducens]MDJ1422197.1 8-amino-7-oxononanoate synthase [Candidatus Methanoperedens sp.]